MKNYGSDSESGEDEKPQKESKTKVCKSVTPNNSSIMPGPAVVNTIVGPINEWLAIPENLPNHPTMAFFGKRRTGKSTTITNIAAACCQDIPFGIVMSDTAYAG